MYVSCLTCSEPLPSGLELLFSSVVSSPSLGLILCFRKSHLDRKSGSQEGRKAGSQEVRKSGSQEVRKAGSQEVRKSGRQEVRKSGSQEVRKSGSQEGRKSGSQEFRKAGSHKGRKSGRQEGRKAGSQEGRQSGNQEVRKCHLARQEGTHLCLALFIEEFLSSSFLKSCLLYKTQIFFYFMMICRKV